MAPVVEKYWNNLKSSVVEEHRAANVVVSGELCLIIKQIDEIVLMIIIYIRYISLRISQEMVAWTVQAIQRNTAHTRS